MKIADLKQLENAPSSGQYLIYTRKKVLFEGYDNLDTVKAILDTNDVLEIHLFNNVKEYRAVASSSKRFENGVIEHITDIDETKEEEIFKDVVSVSDSQLSIQVINHVAYDDNGMVKIDDYRLIMGGE